MKVGSYALGGAGIGSGFGGGWEGAAVSRGGAPGSWVMVSDDEEVDAGNGGEAKAAGELTVGR